MSLRLISAPFLPSLSALTQLRCQIGSRESKNGSNQARRGSTDPYSKPLNCDVFVFPEEFRKKQGKSHLSANLLYFLGTGFRATDSDTMKIVNQNLGRQSRHRPDRTVKKASAEKSVFTEDEFQQFQKEYFGRTVEQGN
ncbi:active regulator of SIRT1 [Salvelinus sp. IW2-2015]|uniref:active regulator of SIRT1 n=1 Tax=Salvelinus sp. IW2-2015 TaxID=2691554 RepID=UPI0038D3BAEE